MQLFKVSKAGGKYIFDPLARIPDANCPTGEIQEVDSGVELKIIKHSRIFFATLNTIGYAPLALSESDTAILIAERG